MTALLALSFILFFEARVESFAPQVRTFTESRLEGIFGDNIKLSIGSLEGGILHPIAVSDCRIWDKTGEGVMPSLEIDSIRSNYHLWDIFFKEKRPHVDVKFALNDRDILGFARIEGTLESADIKGYVDILGTDRIDIISSIKGTSFEAEFRSKYGVVKVGGSLDADGGIVLEGTVNHIKANGFDIVCLATSRNKIGNDYIEGEIETQNLIVNYRPFMDLKASYRIADGVLEIHDLELGPNIKLSGKAGLVYPYNLECVLTADNLDITPILTTLNAREAEAISGTMNGRFEIRGPIENPKMNGRMEMREGEIGGLDFSHLYARLKGDGPIIDIEESRITRPSGHFVLAGEIDLTKAGKGNVFEDIKMVSSNTAIMWDSLHTKEIGATKEVKVEKVLNDDLRLGFKSLLAETTVDESLREGNEMELKYKLHSQDSLKVKVSQDNDFFGFEYEDKF